MKMNRRDFLSAAATTALASSINTSAMISEQQPATAKRIRAIAFDALVIFDLGIVAKRAEGLFPGKGGELTNIWRTRQFEYTWLRTAGDRYRNFWQVTEDALNYASARMGLHVSGDVHDHLMNSYRELQVWPDVRKTLADLRAQQLRMAFLSNFTAEMIKTNLKAAGLDSFFEDHLTTDRVQAFKPSPRAYQMGVDHFGCSQEEIAFAAFAPWDAAGAKWFGYPTLWINRTNVPQEELSVAPDLVTSKLSAPELLSHLLTD
ncbi:MAG TPA: haloacid dehalogenase type II [Terriglobales bacterium]|nr:haloacid dehalogenase type II [Terriglobales bacterium]